MKKTLLKSMLLLCTLLAGVSSAWADDYDETYNYSALKDMISGNYTDASSYWKVPGTAGNTATIAIPITAQPTSDITITFNIATFGSGTNPSSSNTTITAVGTEASSNWSGSTVSSYPSSSTYVNGVLTITKPDTPTTLEGLTITMGVNSGVKIFRLKSITVQYTYAAASVATPTFSPAEGTFTSTQNVTIACETDGATIYYTTDGSTPTSGSSVYSSPISVSETTTIKAIAKKGDDESNVASATYTIYPVHHAGTEADPYTVADARNAIEANIGVTDVYATGIVSEIVTAYDGNNKNITYNISTDGTTSSDQLQAYRCKKGEDVSDPDVEDIQVGDIVVVKGSLVKYGITYEFSQGNVLISLDHPITPLITITPTALTNFTYNVGNGPSAVQTFSVEGSNLSENISVSLDESSNYEISLTEGSGYTNTLNLTPTTGTVAATTIYVRLKAGLAVNASYNGTVTLTSTGAINKTVSLAGSVSQPNITWDLSTASHASATEELVTWSSPAVTMTLAKGSSSTNANNYLGNNSNDHTRFYKDQVLSFIPIEGYGISSVVITAVSSYAAGFTGNSWTNATAETSGTKITVTPTDNSKAVSVVISAACRATSVKVYYEEPAPEAPAWSALPTPTVELENDYILDLSTYVTGYPAPTITLKSTTADGSEYTFVDGKLTFNTTNAGEYDFIFTATNSEGAVDATLTITASGVPEISVPQTSYSTELGGEDVEFTVTATGTPTPTLALSNTTAKSDDYDFDPNDGFFTFTPSATGTFTFTFTATNTAGSDSKTVTVTVGKKAATIPNFANANIVYGSTYTVDDSGIFGGEITVTSENTSIATVNGLNITPVAVGKTTITVATAEDYMYLAGSKTFELTVTAPEGKSSTALFYESFDESTGGPLSTWGGSEANGTLKTDNDGWTLTSGSGAGDCAKFGTGSAKGSATTPSITVENGETYTLSFKAAPWSTETNKTITVTITGGTINGNTSATTSSMTKQKWNEFDFEIVATSTSLTINFDCSANRFFLDEVKIEKVGAVNTANITLNKYGYATFCSVNPMDFTSTTGYTAWRISGIENETITFEKITGTIKGGQGVLLYNKDADGVNTSEVTINFADGTTTFTTDENKLVGTTAPTCVEADTYFGLSGNTFKKVNAGTVPAGKALLPASAVGNASRMIFEFNDNTTGISTIKHVTLGEDKIFDMQGRRVENPSKGLYIVNGKKVILK